MSRLIFFLCIPCIAVFTIQLASAQSKSELNTRFLYAAENNQADSVKYWLDKGADVNYADNGNTAIIWSILNTNRDLLRYLIREGSDINYIDKQGLTPIMNAAEDGDVHTCKILLDSGADISIKNKNGENVIQFAVKNGFKRVANFFIDYNTYTSDSTYSEYLNTMIRYAKNYDFEAAYENGIKALDRAKSELVANHEQSLVIREYLFSICFFFEKYEYAEKQLVDLLSIEEKEVHKSSYATNLLSLSNLLKVQNNDNKADSIMIIAVDLLKDDNPIEWRILLFDILITVYSDLKEYFNCERAILNRLLLIKCVNGTGNIYYVEGLIRLADFYTDMQKTIKEEAVLNELVKIKKLYPNIEIPEYPSKLIRLKNLNKINNHFMKMPLINNNSFAIGKDQKVEDTSILWNEYYGLSEGYYENPNNIGQFIKGRMKSIKEFSGEKSPEYASMLLKLGNWYEEMGQYNNALDSFLQALKITESVFGKEHDEYIKALQALGRLLAGSNHSEFAESIFYKSLEIIKSNDGENSENYCFALCDLAALHHKQGKLYEALELYNKAIEILTTRLNIRELRLAIIMSSIANISIELGSYNEAEAILKTGLQFYKDSLSFKEKRYIHESLLSLYDAKGNYLEAEPHLLQARKITFGFAENAKLNCSTSELSSYWKTLENNFNFYQSLLFRYYHNIPRITSHYVDNVIFTKGALLTNSNDIQQAILRSGDTQLIQIRIKIRDVQQRLAYLKLQPKVDQSDILILEEHANQLDKELTQKSQPYRQAQSELKIQWQDVQANLDENEAAIEFSSFEYFNKHWTDSTLYCALVLKKGMEYPVMVPLCELKQLDTLLLGGHIAPNTLYASRGITVEYQAQQPNGQKLYKLIWEPLEKELGGVQTVYYSPSGLLHQVSFAALPTDTAHYLCDRYNLVQLSGTRQLATTEWQENPQKISSTALFGGIKYDLQADEIAGLQRSFPKNETNTSTGFTPDSTRSSTAFGFLNGTLNEVEGISSTLQSNQVKTTLFTGTNGNEEAFKSLSNQNISVLHLATHGFFYPDEEQTPDPLNGFISFGEQRFRHVSNPLLRSGLILAGGNRTWQGNEPVDGMEDGILTAQEISDMYFPNTELVVLSACETGLGEIHGGEGVFGLQRAFKLAGVKTIIMSLWKVDDTATSEMMQLFYSKWLGGMDKRAAFRLAQQELKKKYKEPYYWAGFVMVD